MSIEIWGIWDWIKTYVFWEMFFGIHKKIVNDHFYEKWDKKKLFFGTIVKEKNGVDLWDQ